jgi:hypothetical protein
VQLRWSTRCWGEKNLRVAVWWNRGRDQATFPNPLQVLTEQAAVSWGRMLNKTESACQRFVILLMPDGGYSGGYGFSRPAGILYKDPSPVDWTTLKLTLVST